MRKMRNMMARKVRGRKLKRCRGDTRKGEDMEKLAKEMEGDVRRKGKRVNVEKKRRYM